MVFFLLVVVVTAYNGISNLRRSQVELFQNDFAVATAVVQIRADVNRARSLVLEMMITKDKAKQRALEENIGEQVRSVDEGIKNVTESLKGQPQELRNFEEIVVLIKDYRKTRAEEIALIYDGQIAKAQELGATIQDERYNKIRSMLLELANQAVSRAKARVAQAEKNAEAISYTFVIIGMLILLVSTGIVLFLSSIIAKPLKEITNAAETIASGDLNVVVHSNGRQDEVGILSKAFSSMTSYLREISSVSRQIAGGDLTVTVKPMSDKDLLGVAFADMIENLRNVNREIRDGVNVLASSTSEILASATQAAAGMAETTTSVSETTVTVEEVKQTSQLTVEKSRSVSENAQKSALVAQQGSDAVARTVEETNNIRKLMESVAESIVKLSEQTQAIGEIMVSVSDLTQQSNLLAVNAAVEASKAGEHGKGFTVVAQEIKSLADQSKQATEQVRVILRDIQKASGASVLAAEQVSKAVDAGVKQATESGESIRRLAASMTEAAQSATQIAASSQQQFAGMDQIAMAMENIKQAAQQNMSGTKQAEKAATDLNELGQKLKEIVSKYKV
jgi:methyl-accepting chemotaxis protein